MKSGFIESDCDDKARTVQDGYVLLEKVEMQSRQEAEGGAQFIGSSS